MSRGIGKTERRILDMLADETRWPPVQHLASKLGMSEGAILAAMRWLDRRGMVAGEQFHLPTVAGMRRCIGKTQRRILVAAAR